MAAIVPPIVCLFQELWHTVLSENLHFIFGGSWQVGWQVLAVGRPRHPVGPPLKLTSSVFKFYLRLAFVPLF